jgi:predicted phage tail component-like protein
MPTVTFNGFSLSDDNFITERVVHRGFASREVRKARVNRREGIKVLGTEFTEKQIEVEGNLVASSASQLQTLLDNMKKALTAQEASLVIDTRTYTATVESLGVPDEHYTLSKAPYSVVFTCSDPFAVVDSVGVSITIPSGQVTVSGVVLISGTFFARPTFTYTPPNSTGDTLIRRIDLYHVQTGQTVTASGFGSGGLGGLKYQNSLVVDLDAFTVTEGGTIVDSIGGYQKFEPGINNITFTASGRAFPGGTLTISYQPRYL